MASASQNTVNRASGFADLPAFSAVPAAESILALTRDQELLQTLRTVAGRPVTPVAAETQLAIDVLGMQGGVAVIDAEAIANPVQELTARLKAQFPELVLVVAGGAEDQAALTRQIGDGTVYRFLHKPVSPQRVKLSIEAAWRRHTQELTGITALTATRPAPALKSKPSPAVFWISGVVVAAIAVGGWLVFKPEAANQGVSSAASIRSPQTTVRPMPEPKAMPDTSAQPAAEIFARVEESSSPAINPTPQVQASAPVLAEETSEPVVSNTVPVEKVTPDEDEERLLAERLIAEEQAMLAAQKAAEGERWTQTARAAIEQQILTTPKAASAAPSIPASRPLVKTHHENPEFPQGARDRGLSGWVDAELTVQPDGTVGEAAVIEAEPRGVFDKAALAAVRKWRYEPREEGAEPRQTKVRIRFELQ